MLDDEQSVNGTVDTIIYQSNESGYCVCDIESDKGELITAVGIMPYVSAGDGVRLYGSYTTHQIYGRQFKVQNYEKILPTGKNEILKYLSSGVIRGIGPKIAEKIVEQYGEDSFDVISEHPEWLTHIRGISKKKALEISADFKEKTDMREIFIFCKDKFPLSTVMRIYKKWGRNALDIIKQNPYKLCSEIYGISFKRADDMARSMGIEPENAERIKSAIRYVLGVFASRDGHTYVKEDNLCKAVSSFLDISLDKIETFLSRMDSAEGICKIKYRDEVHIYKKDLYEAEQYIAKKLFLLNKTVSAVDIENIFSIINSIEVQNDIKYAAMQRKAIEEALENGIVVLTGGPGTGKTTVVKALLQIFKQIGMKCALCAPTGRASKRMSEATSNEAKTIHRLLEMNSTVELNEEVRFVKNENNLLEEDVFIVDEASMIDVTLMSAFLHAVKSGARIILIGDIHQLPSVGEGEVLKDIIKSECFSVVFLKEIFRQSENSDIVVNAHMINQGKRPDLSIRSNDFFFISKEEKDIPVYISELCGKRIPDKFGKTMFDGIQVITPSKKGLTGTVNLNSVFQEGINPPSYNKKELLLAPIRIFREGDKVMQIRNNYNIEWKRYGEDGNGIFNGEIGIIKNADNANGRITVNFDDKIVEYDASVFEELEHSYAITVHKSQGSEYPIVVIPLCSCAPMLLTRNLLYTAITRAQNMVILVGKKEIFYKMIENDTQISRNTGLEKFLRHENENT